MPACMSSTGGAKGISSQPPSPAPRWGSRCIALNTPMPSSRPLKYHTVACIERSAANRVRICTRPLRSDLPRMKSREVKPTSETSTGRQKAARGWKS